MADLIDEYREIHARGKYFPGYSIGDYARAIAPFVEQHKPERMLDYGCGRGMQYLKRRYHERWGGLLPHCYDPGVRELAEKPEGTFGGVLCVDVLEHIERADIPAILDDLFSLTDPGGFLFLVISCRPTRKRLRDGRDVHVTIEPPSWWKDLIDARLTRSAALHAHKPRVIAHFDVAGHFGEPETPWDSAA